MLLLFVSLVLLLNVVGVHEKWCANGAAWHQRKHILCLVCVCAVYFEFGRRIISFVSPRRESQVASGARNLINCRG